MKFVLKNRNAIIKPEYDIVIGATADAAAQDIIENFTRKYKTRKPSKKDYRELLSRLSVNNYPRQICLLSDRAVAYFNARHISTTRV